MMNIGSSSMLTGTNLAVKARSGPIIRVGTSIRAKREAMINFFSSFGSSWSSSVFSGRVLRSRFAPRTTKIKGTATPAFDSIAWVSELLMNVPLSKKAAWRAGIDATKTAMSMAQSGGFINPHMPLKNRFKNPPIPRAAR